MILGESGQCVCPSAVGAADGFVAKPPRSLPTAAGRPPASQPARHASVVLGAVATTATLTPQLGGQASDDGVSFGSGFCLAPSETALIVIACPRAWFMAVSLVVATPLFGAGPIYKCAGKDGSIEFSNLACPTGMSMSAVSARPNAIDMSGMREQDQKEMDRRRQELARAAAADAYIAGGSGANECPSDVEIRNMEAQSGSITHGKKEREFLQAETRRARQCRQGQGNYNAADWQVSRQARADQNSLTGRENGRMRAEAMHSGADPVEAERIRLGREAEEQRRAARQAAASRVITNCDSAGCNSSDGTRYNSLGGGMFSGPQGTCRRVGQQLLCP